MKYGRTDLNQKSIVSALRKVGAFVHIMSDTGKGCPDILACANLGQWYVAEIKSPGGKLTSAEAEWITACGGHVWILRSPEDALRMIGL